MKRLSDNAIEIVNELHTEKLAYESEYVPIIDALNRLAEYEDTEEQGLLVRLPCKLGIPVYCLMGDGVYSETVEKICVSDMGFYLETENMGFDESDFGKYVFLTREEAKKALEGVNGL